MQHTRRGHAPTRRGEWWPTPAKGGGTRNGSNRILSALAATIVLMTLPACATPVKGSPTAAAPTVATTSAPAATTTAPPTRTALDAALLPVDSAAEETLIDRGSTVSGPLLINCTATLPADSRLRTAVQRWWDGDAGGPQDFETGDVTVGHVVATYDGLSGSQVVDQVREVAGQQCRTYISTSGSTWELDRETSTSVPGGTSWGYCIHVIAPANRYGYTCTSYAARADVISRLTVSVAAQGAARSKSETSTRFDELARLAASRLPT